MPGQKSRERQGRQQQRIHGTSGLLETFAQVVPVHALGWQGAHRGAGGAQSGGCQGLDGPGYSHMLPGKVEQEAQRWDGALSEEWLLYSLHKPSAPAEGGSRGFFHPCSASSPAWPAKLLYIRTRKEAGQRELKIYSLNFCRKHGALPWLSQEQKAAFLFMASCQDWLVCTPIRPF